MSQTTSASSQSDSSQSATPAPLPRPTLLLTYVSATQKHEQCTQTDAILDASLLAVKIENKLLKNEITNLKQRLDECQREKVNDNFCVNDVIDDDEKCKFYTGLMWNFLGSAKDKLIYWNQPLKNGGTSPSKRPGARRKLSPMDELFLTLVSLRVGLLNADLSYRFGVSTSSVSQIVTKWIQFLYLQFGTLRNRMFPSRDILKLNMPPCFAKFKDIRVIIDCCEFFVEQSMHFRRQGNLYSSYKNHSTYKCLVEIAPSGAVMYI